MENILAQCDGGKTIMKLSAINAVLAALALLLALPARPGHSAFGENEDRMEVALEAMERLTPDLTAPPVSFAVRKNDPQAGLFSDGADDGSDNVGAWQIQIYDQSGRKRSFIQGVNSPFAAALPWAGISSDGDPLPDGFYNARLVWTDSNKRVHTTQKISVSLFTPLEIRNLSARKLRLKYTEEGLVLGIAENLIFKSGQSKIQDEALPALREISVLLKSYAKNMVTVRGYTDSSGSSRRNLLLSGERAARVYQYLVDAGIDPGRLTYQGLGSVRPVASNTTETGRAQNRRVEVVVLKKTI
ncbi:MAG TPA: hypothetical protein DEF68_10800 [Elusimicrobia bacterium]|nr:hypothetical protein [Elusimicrobiota bacterium]HBW23850.1 hypothetical protein [Elusimicrobiota bacterium]